MTVRVVDFALECRWEKCAALSLACFFIILLVSFNILSIYFSILMVIFWVALFFLKFVFLFRVRVNI